MSSVAEMQCQPSMPSTGSDRGGGPGSGGRLIVTLLAIGTCVSVPWVLLATAIVLALRWAGR